MIEIEPTSPIYEQQAQFLKLLTHPARLAILDVLRDNEACVCHLEAVLGFRQAYISQQLAVLREAGLIQDRREGWNVFYQVSNPQIFTVIDAVESLAHPGQVERPPRPQAVNCLCPKCSGKN